MLISREFLFLTPIPKSGPNSKIRPLEEFARHYWNWRRKREFARLEQPVTGVTAHAGVARCLEKRKSRANLTFLAGLETVVSVHAGVSTFQIGTKFEHLEAECLGLGAREGILTCGILGHFLFWVSYIAGHMRGICQRSMAQLTVMSLNLIYKLTYIGPLLLF